MHFSAVTWPSGDITRHLCENCYPKEEAERIASYTPKRKSLPVIDVADMTAQDYLLFSAKAQANSADAPAYRHLSAELKRFPATRQRIATEMLTIALDSLEK